MYKKSIDQATTGVYKYVKSKKRKHFDHLEEKALYFFQSHNFVQTGVSNKRAKCAVLNIMIIVQLIL